MTPSGHGRHRARTPRRRLSWSPGPASFAGFLELALFFPSAAGPPVGATTSAAEGPEGGRQIALEAGSAPAAAAAPLRVRIPSIGVDSPLAGLGVDDEGVLVPPGDFDRAGWFSGGPVPGDVGPSVIAGHVDSQDGPAVFFRLRDLVAGDAILVDRADGTTARFIVSATDRYAKDAFPTAEVYGPTPDAQLRLITCGGSFDQDARSYLDNVVVFAHAN